MLVVIRGGGDLATGIALRLYRAKMQVVICEAASPTSIRRTVCFSEAVRLGETVVEGVTARRAALSEVPSLLAEGIVPVLVDPEAACVRTLRPDAVVDAILAKRNLGTAIDMAPIVVAAGPGFTAGEDCHAVVETMRGHYLGRAIYSGSALPNTNIPGLIGGSSGHRRTGFSRAQGRSATGSGPATRWVTWLAYPWSAPLTASCGACWPTALP